MKNLTEEISSKIALSLSKSKDKTSEEFAVLKYGVFVVIQTSLSVILTALFGIITNTFIPIVTISIIGSLMKRYSGGAHCTSPNRCLITGIILNKVLIHSFIILYKKCPVGSINKPLKRKETRMRLRKKAFFIYSVCAVLFILSIVLKQNRVYINLKHLVTFMILGLYMQVLSLTFMGNKFILFMDKVLLRINI